MEARVFFRGALTTAKAPDELLTEVALPPTPPRTGACFLEVARRHGDFALVAVAAVATLDASGTCTRARLAFAGVGSTPLRAERAETLLLGGGGDAALFAEAARVVSEGLEPGQRPPRLGGLPPRSRRSADPPRAGPRLGARGTTGRVRPTRVVRVTVNGETYERLVEVRKSLADFLRQDLELTGTHLGCEHGVCGACTVLLDGQPVRSCLLFAVQLDGAELQTVEGLARDAVLHPIQEAFRDNFALQCGYCTPGFLLIAYDLAATRSGPEPRGDPPRAGGEHLPLHRIPRDRRRRGGRRRPAARSAPVMESPTSDLEGGGQPVKRVEDPRLLAGQGRYVDDLRLPRMVSAAFVQSPHAHARLRRVDVSRAAALPGVVGVLTAEEAARRCRPWRGILTDYVGMKTPLQYPLAVDKVRYVGEPVVAIAAVDRYVAEDACDLVEVEYEPLPAVVDPEAAMRSGAPAHRRGIGRQRHLPWRLRQGRGRPGVRRGRTASIATGS